MASGHAIHAPPLWDIGGDNSQHAREGTSRRIGYR